MSYCPYCDDTRGERLLSYLVVALAGFFVGAGVVALLG